MSCEMSRPLPWMGNALALLDKGIDVKIMPHGLSMLPFIMGDRDEVILSKITRELKRGDIVLYKRISGQYVLHRLHHKNSDGLFFMGDSQNFIEGPILKEDCLALVETYYKKGRLKNNSTWDMKIKYTVWFWLRPVRWKLIKLNAWRRRVLSR